MLFSGLELLRGGAPARVRAGPSAGAARADQTLSSPKGTAHFRSSCPKPVNRIHKVKPAGGPVVRVRFTYTTLFTL